MRGYQPEENKNTNFWAKKMVCRGMWDGVCNDSEELCSEVWRVRIKCSEYSGTSIYRVEDIYSEEHMGCV